MSEFGMFEFFAVILIIPIMRAYFFATGKRFRLRKGSESLDGEKLLDNLKEREVVSSFEVYSSLLLVFFVGLNSAMFAGEIFCNFFLLPNLVFGIIALCCSAKSYSVLKREIEFKKLHNENCNLKLGEK